MKKKLLTLLVAGITVMSVSLPAGATTSYLDVKKGDVYSYWTLKDDGALWDNYFYVTPTVVGGANAIYAKSYAQDESVSSAYHKIANSSSKYNYGKTANGGKLYRLQAYANPDSYAWQLVGKYTP